MRSKGNFLFVVFILQVSIHIHRVKTIKRFANLDKILKKLQIHMHIFIMTSKKGTNKNSKKRFRIKNYRHILCRIKCKVTGIWNRISNFQVILKPAI